MGAVIYLAKGFDIPIPDQFKSCVGSLGLHQKNGYTTVGANVNLEACLSDIESLT